MSKKNRKIDTKTTKQVVIDVGLHKMLKKIAVEREIRLRELVEGYLYDGLEKDRI